jgi:hypothetical protein
MGYFMFVRLQYLPAEIPVNHVGQVLVPHMGVAFSTFFGCFSPKIGPMGQKTAPGHARRCI